MLATNSQTALIRVYICICIGEEYVITSFGQLIQKNFSSGKYFDLRITVCVPCFKQLAKGENLVDTISTWGILGFPYVDFTLANRCQAAMHYRSQNLSSYPNQINLTMIISHCVSPSRVRIEPLSRTSITKYTPNVTEKQNECLCRGSYAQFEKNW